MWPRVVELMLAVWLAASPLVLRLPAPSGFEAVHAYACAVIVVTASCLSHWEPTRHSRALTAIVGFWLAGRAYLIAPYPAPPMIQNEFLIGLLFLMFAIVPNEAARPSRSWRPFIRAALDPNR